MVILFRETDFSLSKMVKGATDGREKELDGQCTENTKHKYSKRGRTIRTKRCAICGQMHSGNLEQHQDSHRVNGWFECEKCDWKENDFLPFVRHLKTHVETKSVKCEKCDRILSSARLLRDHMNLHNGETPYLCSICGKQFSLKGTLAYHYRSHHQPHKYKCSYCRIGINGRGDLLKHERTHTGERPYVCKVCGEGYIQSSHLNDHARTHLGQRPNKCDLCGRGFLKKSDMLRHRRIHTGEFPYLCLVCGKSFRQSTQCSNHVKTHHPEAVHRVQREQLRKSAAAMQDEKENVGQRVVGDEALFRETEGNVIVPDEKANEDFIDVFSNVDMLGYFSSPKAFANDKDTLSDLLMNGIDDDSGLLFADWEF